MVHYGNKQTRIKAKRMIDKKEEIVRCKLCNGQGKCAPLGGIVKECIHCKGIGYIAFDNSEDGKDEKDKIVEQQEIKVKRKYNFKKKK